MDQLENVVGIDKDDITLEEAKQLKNKILDENQCQIILYQTQRGYHLELIFQSNIDKKTNFAIRKKYGDCNTRMEYSRKRIRNHDILFEYKHKNNIIIWRKRIYDT